MTTVIVVSEEDCLRGLAVVPPEGEDRVAKLMEMPQAPRIGDQIVFNEDGEDVFHEVINVAWIRRGTPPFEWLCRVVVARISS